MGIDKRVRADGTTSYRVRRQWGANKVVREFATLDEAERYELELNQQIRAGRYLAPSTLTVGECVLQYIARKQRSWQGKTTETHELTYRRRIAPDPIARVPVVEVTLQQVQAWIDRMSGAPATVRVAGAAMTGALGDAARLGIIPANPALGIEYPPIPRHAVNPWTRDEVRRVYAVTTDRPRLHAFYRLALTLGLRSGEIRALHWEDMRGDRLHVHRTATRQGIREGTKRGDGRTITLPASVMVALDRWCPCPRSGLVFPSHRDGEALVPYSITRWHETTITQAGVRRIRVHDLRHTAATLMLEAGVPLRTVSDILGHASTAMTADIYMHVDADMQRRALDQLGAWIETDT